MKRRTDMGILLVVLGALAGWNAVKWVPALDALSPALKLHSAVFLVGGAAAALAGALLLAGRLERLGAWLGGIGAAASGVNLILGVSLGTIPCAGPG